MSSTTADKINYLLDTKEEIRQAINEKFVDVPTSATFRSYADSIRAIPTGNKMCRFVIGTSTAGWTEKDCDYLCDGVDDQVEINAAIQALPSTGGEIKVLDGTYNITSSIIIDKERVTFSGCGQSTIFKRMWKTLTNSASVISCSKGYCVFHSFLINGNKDLYTGGSGLLLDSKKCEECKIYDVTSNNNTNFGIVTQNLKNIINNIISNNNQIGINSAFSNGVIITNSFCANNETGISVTAATQFIVNNNNCRDNEDDNIGIASATKGVIIGNACINGNGESSDYTSLQHTIYMTSRTTDCVIVGNNCAGKAPTVAGTGNIVENNLS